MRPLVVTLTSLSLAVGCAHVQTERAVVNGKLRSSWGPISTKDHLRARGIGAPPANVVGQARRRALSRQAGLAAARYELLAAVKGVRVSGGLSVADLISQNSKIEETANRLIRGAEEVGVDWTDSDEAVVTLELRRDRIKKLIKEDQRWEPPTERERWEAEVRLREKEQKEPKRLTYSPDFGGKRPLTALGLGLLVPGLGQLYAGGEDSGVGYYSMAGVLGLTGIGVGLIQPHDAGPVRSDGTREQKSAPAAGYAFLGAAALVHVWAAVDGMNMVRDRGGFLAVEPRRDGATVTWNRRF